MNRLFIWVLIGIFLYIILINANNIQEGIKGKRGRGKKGKKGKGMKKGKKGKKKRRRQQQQQRQRQQQQKPQKPRKPPSTFMKLMSYFPSPIRRPIVYVSLQIQQYYSKL